MGDAPERIWAVDQTSWGAIRGGSWADTIRQCHDGVEYIRADLHQAALDRAEAIQRNIISHATMGGTTGEGMSLNDICVLITAIRNELYQQAKAQAEADKAAALEAMRDADIAAVRHLMMTPTDADLDCLIAAGISDITSKDQGSPATFAIYEQAIRSLPVTAPMTATRAARVPEVAALRDKVARLITLDHLQLLADFDVDGDLYRTDPECGESAYALADAILTALEAKP